MRVTLASDRSLPEPGGELSTYSRLSKSILKIDSIRLRPIRAGARKLDKKLEKSGELRTELNSLIEVMILLPVRFRLFNISANLTRWSSGEIAHGRYLFKSTDRLTRRTAALSSLPARAQACQFKLNWRKTRSIILAALAFDRRRGLHWAMGSWTD
jgi:hypothetical protein